MKAVERTEEKEAGLLDTLAVAYDANGQREKAIEAEKKALALKPNQASFKQHLEKYSGEADRKSKP